MEPHSYGEVKEQLRRTQDVEWVARVLVYGAINRLPGWPSLWELMIMAGGAKEMTAASLLRAVVARTVSLGASRVVGVLPVGLQAKLLEVFRQEL